MTFGGEVSLTHWMPLSPVMLLVLIFTRGCVNPRAMVWSEGNVTEKYNDILGIDPGTVQLVAQRLNHYANPGVILWPSKNETGMMNSPHWRYKKQIQNFGRKT